MKAPLTARVAGTTATDTTLFIPRQYRTGLIPITVITGYDQAAPGTVLPSVDLFSENELASDESLAPDAIPVRHLDLPPKDKVYFEVEGQVAAIRLVLPGGGKASIYVLVEPGIHYDVELTKA